MKDSKPVSIAAGGVLLVSLGALFVFWGGMPPRVDTRVHEEIGRALAQEALQLLKPGGKIAVVTRDTDAFKQPAADISLQSFAREVGRAGASLAAVQKLQDDPLRPVQVPGGDFFELIRRGAAGDVIVSFMGPPLLTEEQRSSLGEIKPRIVAFCPGNLPAYINLRLLAEQKLLHAALLSRPQKPGPATAAATQATFNDLYVRADAAQLVRLPALAGEP